MKSITSKLIAVLFNLAGLILIFFSATLTDVLLCLGVAGIYSILAELQEKNV